MSETNKDFWNLDGERNEPGVVHKLDFLMLITYQIYAAGTDIRCPKLPIVTKFLLTTLMLCAVLFSSALLAENPPPRYADQDYDPLPANYAEIAKQHVASRFKDFVYVRVVGGPLHTAYPVEIDGKTNYRPCWNLLLKAQGKDGEQMFMVFFYKDRVVGTMTTKP